MISSIPGYFDTHHMINLDFFYLGIDRETIL